MHIALGTAFSIIEGHEKAGVMPKDGRYIHTSDWNQFTFKLVSGVLGQCMRCQSEAISIHRLSDEIALFSGYPGQARR